MKNIIFACITIFTMGICSMAQSGVKPDNSSELNYFQYEGHKFRYQSSLMLWTPVNNSSDRITAVIPAGKVLGMIRSISTKPSSLRAVDSDGKPCIFGIFRDGKLLNQDTGIKNSDLLVTEFQIPNPDRIECPVIIFVFGAGSLPHYDKYGLSFPNPDSRNLVTDTSLDKETGILDYTGPVDMKQPASKIQMDMIYSARWGTWYEFAHRPTGAGTDTPLFAIPINPIKILIASKNQSTCFNMDDIPRFPLYYIRYYKATLDNRALVKARQGLDTIIRYTRPDGTMPYLLSPSDGDHFEGHNLFEIYHCIRTVSEAIPLFKNDPKFCSILVNLYERYRSYIFGYTKQGLFQNLASANGAVLDAVYHRWEATKDPRDLNDIRLLADAICTDYARTQRSDFGEYIPWVPLGLTLAYKATDDIKYKQEAEDWIRSSIIPSIRQDRRYYHTVPDFKASGVDKPWGANPLQIWYHADAFLTMYKILGDEKYYKMAAWTLGDYYDANRYNNNQGAIIIDTKDPYTERWGSASAEDALRMIDKYLWQLQYPSLFEDARSNALTSNRCPWLD